MKTLIYLLIPAFLLTIAFAQAPPPPELKDPFLDNFVGDWRVERKMGNGRIAESTVHGEWSLKHHYIQLHYGFADKSPAYEALVFIGFVEPEKTYACHWLDVYGAGFDAPGRGKLDNEKHSIEFRWDSKEGALTNKFTFDSQAKTWTSLIRQVKKASGKRSPRKSGQRNEIVRPQRI